MSRNLKALGLALIAVLALGAVGAGAAQAETLVESELASPAVTTLDGVDVTGTEDGKLARLTVGTGARFIECTQAKQVSGATITGSSLTVNATPTYEKCFANALKAAPVTVTHNKCTLKLTALKTNTGNVTIECPHGGVGQIEVHVFENEAAEKENKPICTYDIKPQTLTGAGITAAGAGATRDLTLNLSTLSKLTLTNTGPGGIAVCGIAANAVGTGAFTGKITVTGTNSVEKQVGIFLK